MKIDVSCGDKINSKDVYVHDDILEDILFKRSEKKLFISLFKQGTNKKVSIEFQNVIGFEMTNCNFWGESPYILDFEYIKNSECVLIPKLFKQKNENAAFCKLEDESKYIETVITFISGDKLRIACESIFV